MPGLESLIAAFEDGTLLRPLHDEPNLVDLARAVALLMGVDVERSTAATEIEMAVGEADHFVLVLADGVGMNMVESLPRNSFLPRHLRDELLTVFPSTTSVALTSLATAQWPAVHAITGWWTHLPQLGSAATILQYKARSDDRDLLEHGIDPGESFPVDSVWSLIPRDVCVIVPDRIRNSAYSSYFNGGRSCIGYKSLTGGVDQTISRVMNATEKTFTYLYVPRVDSVAHAHGISRPEVRHALLEVDNQIGRLYSAIGSKARLVVTADHGFLDAPASSRHTLRANREIQPLLRFPPSGDARVVYFHTWDWARERLRRYFERRFDDRFILIDVDDAISLGLFGPEPPSAQHRERFGDQMAISKGADILEYNAARGSGRMVQLNSHHSGLTPEEMRIPLIVA